MPGPLLAVDAPSLLFRAWFALPDSITDAEGNPTNALLGTANLILWVLERRAPRAVVLCYGAEAATYRTALFPRYHADRPPVPDGLERQFADAGDFFGAFGWTSLTHPELEADDLLGALARVEVQAGGEALLFTGDRDMFQCVGERVRVLFPGSRATKEGPEEIGPEQVRGRYGVEPEQVPDFIALRGDPSDGLPGAKGIGEKTAADLLRRHGTLDAALDAAIREKPAVRKALIGQRDELLMFRDVATLRLVDLERPPDAPTDWAGGASAAEALGLRRLAERLRGLADARG